MVTDKFTNFKATTKQFNKNRESLAQKTELYNSVCDIVIGGLLQDFSYFFAGKTICICNIALLYCSVKTYTMFFKIAEKQIH